MDHVDVSLTDRDIVQKVITLQHNLTTCKIEPHKRNKQIFFELVRRQNEINRLISDASESIASIQAKMMEIAALRYTLCEDTTHIEDCVIEDLKIAPNELNPKFLEQLTESIQIIHTNITGVTLSSAERGFSRHSNNEQGETAKRRCPKTPPQSRANIAPTLLPPISSSAPLRNTLPKNHLA